MERLHVYARMLDEKNIGDYNRAICAAARDVCMWRVYRDQERAGEKTHRDRDRDRSHKKKPAGNVVTLE
jgi:hypothetical protein